MITNVLSDPAAKLFTYGRNTPLVLKDRPAASKTGTTDNYRDTWTDGYTTNLAIVVWVGNTDGHPMKQALSSMTAGKIWPEAIQASFEVLNLPAEDFPRPDGLSEQQVCGDTALRPGEPACRPDLFVAGQNAAPTSAPTARATSAATPAAEPTRPPEPTQAAQPTDAPPAPVAPAAPAPAQPAPTAAPKPQPTAAPPAKPAPTPAPPKPTPKPGG
jgi:membrane peptidoglycan carboxypeptidase